MLPRAMFSRALVTSHRAKAAAKVVELKRSTNWSGPVMRRVRRHQMDWNQ